MRTKSLLCSIALGLVLAVSACGASTKTSSGGSGTSNSAEIDQMTAAAEGQKKATFKAVYTTYNGSTVDSTVTIEQMPPKAVFITGSTRYIDDGTKTYSCSEDSGQTMCLVITGTGSTGSLAGITQAYSSDLFVNQLKTVEAQAALKIAGIDIKYTSETFAGQDSRCVIYTVQKESAKYCATKSGYLAYSGNASSHFQLTSLSTSVSASDFQPPPGATMQEMPS